MLFGRGILSLAQAWKRNAPIALAPILEATRLRRDEGCEDLPVHEAVRCFDSMKRRPPWRIRQFVSEARLSGVFLRDVDDWQLLEIIRQAIKDGRLIALRKGDGAGKGSSETVERRRLVRHIEQQTRGRMSYAGRQYKLVVDVDLASAPGRDGYEVVGRDEALRVLDGLAKQSGTGGELAGLLGQASAKLSPDWRLPFTEPDGLLLLRRSTIQSTTKPNDGLAITPSQLRALLDQETPLQFFARFVDERGKPVTGFSGDFEHNDDPKADMVFSGSDFVRMGELKGARQAWLTFPDGANQDVVDALKKRWKEIRGAAEDAENDAWKKNEEAIVEVLFKDGKLPELQLEAEKKHTFMLRPPVALARLHGLYFDTNKCFILPSAVASLKRLVEIYELHPDSEVLIAGHTDTAGSEAYNLDLSADRADAMKAYLRDDAEAWLAWYDSGVREGKRWSAHEDAMMIDAMVPENAFGKGSHIAAYQTWHNGEVQDAREPGQARRRPKAWEMLKADGIMGPKTRRQLILDYMNLDKTSLPEDARVVTYGCGESFPLASEEGDIAPDPKNDEDVQFDRRVEVFFFSKPFGILPAVPGVADGDSPAKAVKAASGNRTYPEWRLRATHRYTLEAEAEGFRLRLCDLDVAPYAERPFAFCLDGYPEIRGTTDRDGFAIIDTPPAGAQGYVAVWPDDEQPDDKIRWDITIAPIISPATPRGASTRLANLDFFADEPTDDMTEELQESISYFQGDCDGLEVTGELDSPTCERLLHMHDCEDADSEGGGTPAAEASNA